MGYMRHHAVVISADDEYQDIKLDTARDHAVALGCTVTEVVGPTVNGVRSFMVAPDGSKEGWADSDTGDARRSDLIEWLRGQGYNFDWAEIQYGDDDGRSLVVRHSDEDIAP